MMKRSFAVFNVLLALMLMASSSRAEWVETDYAVEYTFSPYDNVETSPTGGVFIPHDPPNPIDNCYNYDTPSNPYWYDNSDHSKGFSDYGAMTDYYSPGYDDYSSYGSVNPYIDGVKTQSWATTKLKEGVIDGIGSEAHAYGHMYKKKSVSWSGQDPAPERTLSFYMAGKGEEFVHTRTRHDGTNTIWESDAYSNAGCWGVSELLISSATSSINMHKDIGITANSGYGAVNISGNYNDGVSSDTTSWSNYWNEMSGNSDFSWWISALDSDSISTFPAAADVAPHGAAFLKVVPGRHHYFECTNSGYQLRWAASASADSVTDVYQGGWAFAHTYSACSMELLTQ